MGARARYTQTDSRFLLLVLYDANKQAIFFKRKHLPSQRVWSLMQLHSATQAVRARRRRDALPSAHERLPVWPVAIAIERKGELI